MEGKGGEGRRGRSKGIIGSKECVCVVFARCVRW